MVTGTLPGRQEVGQRRRCCERTNAAVSRNQAPTPPPRAGESPLAVPNEVTRRGAAMPGDRQPAQRGTSSSAASKAPRVRPLGLRPPEPPVSFPRRARRAHMALFVTLAQVAAGAPAPELPALYMTVSPTSVLHLSPSSPETTLAICKAHDNIRHDYFRAMCARNKEQSSGWVLLDNAAWVENTTLGVLIAVTGPTALFQNRSAICTAAALLQEAMPFNSLGQPLRCPMCRSELSSPATSDELFRA